MTVRPSTPWPQGDPNVVIHQVLAQPGFRVDHVPPQDISPLLQLLQKIAEFFGRILGAMYHGARGAGLGWLVVGLVYAAAIGGIAYAAYAIARAYSRRAPRAASGLPGTARELESASPESLHWGAARAAERGEYAHAIALLFRAALLALDRAAIVVFDAARTPGEYRRRVRRVLAAASQPFDDLTQGFVRVTFGADGAKRSDYEAAANAYAAFVPKTGES